MAKEITKKVKRPTDTLGKILGNRICDKDLLSRIYEELLQFNSKTMNNPI